MERHAEHPGPARLTVRVGVTGHRRVGLDGADEKKLRDSIRGALEEIRRAAKAIAAEAGELYQNAPPVLHLLSSLAEGADQVAAEEALELGYELHCPLPFAPDAYARGFDGRSKGRFEALLARATAVLQLDGSAGGEACPEAFLAAGRLILRQCDVLLAVWDGKEARGRGGTGQIVAEAAALEVPTVWVDSTPPYLVRLRAPKAVGESAAGAGPQGREQGHSPLGELLRESFLPSREPFHQHRSPIFRARAWILGRLGGHLPRSEWDRARAFFREGPPRRGAGLFFGAYRFFWTGARKRVPQRHEAWVRFSGQRPDLAARFETHYGRHFQWVDGLANACVGKYRDSFVLTYLLGAFAVLSAFLGLQAAHHAGPDLDAAHAAGIPWFVLELVLILAILGLTLFGSLSRWHERWMDYRPLAEALRQMKFLDLFGRVPPSAKVPAHLAAGDPWRSWFNWHFRSLVRQAGMIGGPPESPVVLDALFLRDLRVVLAEAIEEQVKYHESNHRTFHALHRRSHLMGQAFFVATAMGCALHLFHQPRLVDVGLSFVAIVLPGFGAALSAILHHGEFERIALRSKALEGRLRELLRELKSAEEAREQPASQSLGRIAETFSEVTMSELVDWRFAFLEKDLTLP